MPPSIRRCSNVICDIFDFEFLGLDMFNRDRFDDCFSRRPEFVAAEKLVELREVLEVFPIFEYNGISLKIKVERVLRSQIR